MSRTAFWTVFTRIKSIGPAFGYTKNTIWCIWTMLIRSPNYTKLWRNLSVKVNHVQNVSLRETAIQFTMKKGSTNLLNAFNWWERLRLCHSLRIVFATYMTYKWLSIGTTMKSKHLIDVWKPLKQLGSFFVQTLRTSRTNNKNWRRFWRIWTEKSNAPAAITRSNDWRIVSGSQLAARRFYAQIVKWQKRFTRNGRTI